MSYKNIDPSRQLYVELARSDGHVLTPEEQEDNFQVHCQCCGTTLRQATQEEIRNAKDYYNRHNKCEHHLVYDEPGGTYDFRYCGICGKFINAI